MHAVLRAIPLALVFAAGCTPQFRSSDPGQPAYIAHPKIRRVLVASVIRGRHKDGTEFPVEIIQSRLDAGGRTEVIAVIRDISARSTPPAAPPQPPATDHAR